jgi:uncharacterized repeat protein (TIGR03809 family)
VPVPIARPVHAFDQISGKWRDLAERRKEHFSELYRSGRWRRYYTEEQFRTQMREVIRAAETWAQLAAPRSTVEAAE